MSKDIPQWAMDRSDELMEVERPKGIFGRAATYYAKAFARYIAEHEEPPVDPLREEAVRFADSWAPDMVTPSPSARRDRLEAMALAALKRGMELAK